ncbi:MAG: flagellar motor protein [Gammaproteobacteria bacterium]|nr:MAG: flagellar motor protein [Gammaproteobacteria bacterium]
MDFLSLAGVALSLVAVIGGNLLEGGHTDSLIQLTAFVIVFGGTLGATLVQTPQKIFVHGIRRFKWVFFPPKIEGEETLKKIITWSKTARKDGLLGLQNTAAKEPDKFAKKGLLLLVDGNEPGEISKILEIEIDSIAANEMNAARVYEAMGGYSPTIGIIGAVMGLIHVMNNLADPSALGPGIAVAFVATIYGVGLANFFFLPMSNKLKTISSDLTQYQEMLLEGVVSIAEGENPMAIASKLEGYLT